MDQVIMIACDLHDETMVLKFAVGREPAAKCTLANTPQGCQQLRDLIRQLRGDLDAARVLFAYEASGLGFGLYDELTAAGVECVVLAPTKIARSVKQRRNKTDDKDADQILELLRGHVLAGNPLPAVWVPDRETRDDREVVRARLDVAGKLTLLKAQVQSLLKRNYTRRAAGLGEGWTKKFWQWLIVLSTGTDWGPGARSTLASLLRQITALEEELQQLASDLGRLADKPRYAAQLLSMTELKGVGLLTALVFLTELGDLTRFANRRQVAAYLGLAPTAFESGARNDAKGRISKQGPARVRKVLCQATWSRVRYDASEQAAYERIVTRNPKRKKIAVVASMRRLAIRLWHAGCNARLAEEAAAVVAVVSGGVPAPVEAVRSPRVAAAQPGESPVATPVAARARRKPSAVRASGGGTSARARQKGLTNPPQKTT